MATSRDICRLAKAVLCGTHTGMMSSLNYASQEAFVLGAMRSRCRQQHYVHVMYFYMHQSSNNCFSQDPRGLYAELDVRFHAGLFPRSLRSGDTCFWCVAGAVLLCFICQDARYSPRLLFWTSMTYPAATPQV